MKYIYILSVIFLFVFFLLYKKTDKKICFWSAIIYSLALLVCYNTFIVYIAYLLKLDGSLLLYSIINFVVGSILLVLTFIRKKGIQKYSFDKRKLIVILLVGLIVFLVGFFRFRGFNEISYESGDSAVHYRHALVFSEELTILDESNSRDYVFNKFVRVLPISYINCGFLFNLLSGFKTYIVFSIYNVLFLVLSALVFFITIIDIFKYNKKDYIYGLILTIFYILAFPLNNFIMGFCYFGISIMVINLLYLTIYHFKDEWEENLIFKLIVILLITFACFYSYYLFVPVVYLSLGLYYLWLWKNKKLTFGKTIIYGFVTLIVPFVLGFCYFCLPILLDKGIGEFGKFINLWGYSYNNITPVYLFVFVTLIYLYNIKLKKEKINYININICIMSLYVFIFLVLWVCKLSDFYYFYKLFSLYWLLVVLYMCKFINKHKNIFYIFFYVLMISNIFVYNFYFTSSFARMLPSTNIYSWNSLMMKDERIIYNKEELELLEESLKYYDECRVGDRFLMVGKAEKNVWYYSMNNTIPVAHDVKHDWTLLNIRHTLDFNKWGDTLLEYDCLIYYYEMGSVDVDKGKFDILYNNNSGVIVKRKS